MKFYENRRKYSCMSNFIINCHLSLITIISDSRLVNDSIILCFFKHIDFCHMCKIDFGNMEFVKNVCIKKSSVHSMADGK